ISSMIIAASVADCVEVRFVDKSANDASPVKVTTKSLPDPKVLESKVNKLPVSGSSVTLFNKLTETRLLSVAALMLFLISLSESEANTFISKVSLPTVKVNVPPVPKVVLLPPVKTLDF
ncbi:MAG: hypothetical protein L3J46_00770, partial [Kangiellaceae bacterium]|nr:hypothetical protein [Kangiellaceae bacterium]